MTTQPAMIPFGEWMPDLPAHMNKGALIAKNVIPQLESYRDLKDLAAFSDALDDVCLGAFWSQDSSNTVFNFAGDATKLYRLDGGNTWTDVSGVSAPYGADNWEFTKYGDRVIASNITDSLQYYDMGTSSAFADLPGSPPSAAHIATVRDFIMLGNIASLGPNYLQWSGYNNTEIWTPSIKTQSDYQQLPGRAGAVQRVVPGEYAVVFCEHSIFRADYAGPPLIFQIDELERKRGTPSPNSVAWAGGLVFYFGWDGFYMFDGIKSTPISHNRTSRWFVTNAASDALSSMRGAVDRLNQIVMWAFKSSASSAINDRLILFNWGANKWAYAEVDTQIIDEYVSSGYDLDTLDTPLPSGIDIDSIPMESSLYQGGALNLQAFNSSNQGATFSGDPLDACIDTKEISSPDQRRLMTNSARAMVEGSPTTSITLQIGTRNTLQENETFSTAKAANGINGEVSLRANSRYQRFRCNISGGFEHANGVKPNSRVSGGRR